MLHYETIEPRTLELLKRLQDVSLLKDTRLVGGTSLALQLGHRKSVDAEQQPMPFMFSNMTWEDVKSKVLSALK